MKLGNSIVAHRKLGRGHEVDSSPLSPPLPALDEALYGIAGEFTEAVAEQSGADQAPLLVPFLTIAAANLGAGSTVDVWHAGRPYPLRLFSVLIGASRDGMQAVCEALSPLFVGPGTNRLGSSPSAPLFVDSGPMRAGKDFLRVLAETAPALQQSALNLTRTQGPASSQSGEATPDFRESFMNPSHKPGAPILLLAWISTSLKALTSPAVATGAADRVSDGVTGT